MKKKTVFLFIIFLSVQFSFGQFIARRSNQYPTDFGYYISPIPYSISGSGSGLGLAGGVNNAYKTTDFIAFLVEGDIKATGFGLLELPFFTRHLLIDYFNFNSSKSAITNYSGRGMNTDKNEFTTIIFADSDLSIKRVTLTFDERRYNIFYYGFNGVGRLDSIIDKDDNVIIQNTSSDTNSFSSVNYGFSIDYTDEQTDPREGIRFDVAIEERDGAEADSVQFDVIDTNLTFYFPVFDFSTIVLNAFDSHASVKKKGLTDRDALIRRSGFNCNILSGATKTKCESDVNKFIQNQIAENTYGTASSLGGISRLRSYPNGRFSGAHTQFYGLEFRWNLTSEKTPFDFFLFKDQRLGYQIAFFYEAGTVAEKNNDLWKKQRSSYGAGFRFLTASGFTYRFDVANGEEGSNVVLFFGFPWNIARN